MKKSRSRKVKRKTQMRSNNYKSKRIKRSKTYKRSNNYKSKRIKRSKTYKRSNNYKSKRIKRSKTYKRSNNYKSKRIKRSKTYKLGSHKGGWWGQRFLNRLWPGGRRNRVAPGDRQVQQLEEEQAIAVNTEHPDPVAASRRPLNRDRSHLQPTNPADGNAPYPYSESMNVNQYNSALAALNGTDEDAATDAWHEMKAAEDSAGWRIGQPITPVVYAERAATPPEAAAQQQLLRAAR